MRTKIFSFKSIVTYLTIISFYIATTLSAVAAPMPPVSLAQMYSLAAQGNVRALRAAVQRGMNIDATDRYGNTGLCHSIYQNNYTAYNAFHASGANPRHPCIQNIPTEQYDYFMASSRATPITATPRDAYKEFADGEFIFSTTAWVVAGAILVGGIAAVALSGGGGGGGGGHYYFPPNDSFTPTDDSLGAFVGTETPSDPLNVPYVPVKITNGQNTTDFILNNDSQITVGSGDSAEKKNLIDVINFNDSVLEYSKYLQVGMKAVDGNQVVNGQIPLTGTEVGTTITLMNNTAGMVALHNANAINNNTLKIIARNGTLGMIGSDRSLIRNNGNIDIAFQGTTLTDQVNGMYVDTSSTAINDGNITGNAAVESVAGTLIGMQGRLINQVQNPAGSIPIQMINNGKIELSATASAGKTISNSLVGMGSFLEKAFIEGTKLLRRAGFIEMTNAGTIELNVNLGDTGTYDTTQSNLLNGTGGIIGMRSDAHTTATNNGSIKLTIAPESATSIENSHAGMLSVHGGTIVNNKNIEINGGIGGYGMLGVRGEGTNSEFNTLNPTIVNAATGTIIVNSVDGFGMATRHGGAVTNNGSIILGEKGTGIQINAGKGDNNGTITLNKGGNGMAIKKNTTAEEGTTYNASTAKIQNGGTININNADGSSGMYIEDGTAENNHIINVNGVNTTTTSSYGIQALSGTVINTGEINMNVLLSGDVDSYGIYGGNATTVTNAGKITSVRKGIGSYTTSGTNTNSGQISMNGIGSTGMASDSGAIINTETGEVSVVSGTGIKSTTGQVTNDGKVTITNGASSTGISSGSSILNNGSIQLTGADSTGISIEENGTAVNNGTITLTSNRNSTQNFGIVSAGGERARIDNNGIITLNGYNYASSAETGYGMSIGDGEANNNNTITINQMYGYGMASTTGKLTNNGIITLTNGGYGIKGESGEIFNSVDGTITVTGTPTLESSFGMSMETGTAKNFGTIDITGSTTNDASYGIYVNGGNGINHNLIEMRSDNAFGLFDAGDGTITNFAGAIINLYGNNSVGMQSSGTKAENFGTINIGVVNPDGSITGGNGGTGMIAKNGATALNSGHINMNGSNAVGMFADGGTVVNAVEGIITLNGGNGTIFKTSNGGTAINQGNIEINTEDYELFNSTDTDGGNFINNGNVNVGASGSKIIVAGDGANITNGGKIDLDGSNGFIIYTSDSGNATNNGTLNISAGSDNSHAIYMDETATGNVLNGQSGVINVNGTNSTGMTLASDDSSVSITNKGKINVSGAGSKGMVSTKGGTVNNEGAIIMSDGSAAIDATGGTVHNKAGGMITTAAGSSANGINITSGNVSGSEAAMVTNDGTITINGNGDGINSKISASSPAGTLNTINNNGTITVNGSGRGIFADAGNINNNSVARIVVSSNGYGIRSSSGTVINDGTIVVSGNNGIGASTGGTLTNGGTITVSGSGAKGMELTTGGIGTNNSTITANGNNSVGIYVNGGNADNLGTLISSGNGSSGIYAASGNAYNQTTINVTGDGSIGMSASSGTAINGKTITITTEDADGNPVETTEYKPGIIDVTGNNAAGMKLVGSGTVLNNKGASITVGGNGATGIWAAGSGSASNEGTITVSAADALASGMKATSGTATNKATINVNGTNALGMHADGGSVVNDTDGKIELTADDTVGIYVKSGSGNNKGTITLSGTGSIGLQADGGTATNSATLELNAANTVGLYANGGTVVNDSSGIINFNNGDAAIQVDSGNANNAGTINVNAGNANAILVNGGSATNNNTITLTSSASWSTAMKAMGGTVTNGGTISVEGENGIGMASENTGQAVNNKSIVVTAASGTGMSASDNSTATNNLTINIGGTNGIGMAATGGNTINGSAGTISVTASGAKAMTASSGTATNNGLIQATTNNTIAMYSNGGTVTNASGGRITTGSSSAYAMLAESNGIANNQGALTFSGTGAAIQANGATANNSGSITASNGIGMAAYGTATTGAKANNSGTITVSNANGKGMVATSSTADTSITNTASGIINVNGASGIGMYADGSRAKAINLGTININTTSASAVGMKAVNGGSVENAGTINMASGSTGTGIYIGTGSKLYNNASGKIVFSGGNTHTGTISGDPSSGSVSICEDGTTTCANKRFIYMESGSQLVNSGTMVTSASFRLNEMGGGQMVLGSSGKLEAGNEISGNLFAMGDENMLAQGQKDVYVNKNALSADSVDVTLKSLSPMWETSLIDSTPAEEAPAMPVLLNDTDKVIDTEGNTRSSNGKDIIYNRVSFNKLVDNSSQAAYLEQNYAIRNSIYDSMMTASSMDSFNRAVYSGLGLDLIPNFAKQNMDVIRSVNRQVNNAVFNNTETKEFRASVGYDYFDREQDGADGLSGYEDHANTVYGVFDKKYNANFRYGLGASVTKYDSDYDNGSERHEVIAQIMVPLLFETENTKILSLPKIGMGWGDYKRFDQGVDYKSDTRNYYYGVTNEIRHDIDTGFVTIEPVAEFNILGLYQNRTKENIRVEESNNLSIEGGLGLYARKSFAPFGEDELNVRIGGTYYHEFNNPYQAAEAGVVGLLGSYHMNSYDAQRNRAVLSTRFDYKRGKFNFYLEGSRFIEDDNTYSLNAGLTYAF